MTKSPAYSPLDSLVDLACRDGVDVRPTLLRVLTDLYVQKPVHTSDEETQYVELALGLIDAVDPQTRAAVAARLSGYAGAPAAIIARLAGPVLPSTGAAATSAAHAPKAEQKSETDDLVELFFAAGSAERRLILVNLDATAAPASRALAPASHEIVRRLENAALQHNTGEFSRTLERGLGISRSLAERITRDVSGEPIVVAAKALGMKAAVLQRILIMLNPAIGQSVARVYELADLFDELSRGAAERMLAIWRKNADTRASRPAHAPVHWDDETRGARSSATPEQHRSARPGERPPERVKSGRDD
jgi:uncharacterized protein (DUF2336 family)